MSLDLQLVITALRDEAKDWADSGPGGLIKHAMREVANRLEGLKDAAGCFCDGEDAIGSQEGCLHPMRLQADGSMICDRCGRRWLPASEPR